MGLSRASQLRVRRGARSLRTLLACIVIVAGMHALRLHRKVGRQLTGRLARPCLDRTEPIAEQDVFDPFQVGAGLDSPFASTGTGGRDAAAGGDPCASSSLPAANSSGWQGVPKVALMFLTRGDLPYEPLWRAFLDSASELGDTAAEMQAAAATAGAGTGEQQGRQSQPDFGGGGSSSNTATLWQRLFGGGGRPADASCWARLYSIYTHPAPGWSHPPGSLFAGHEVACRQAVEWGNHSVIDAERALLRAALADPANQRELRAAAPGACGVRAADGRAAQPCQRLQVGLGPSWRAACLSAWGVVGVHRSCVSQYRWLLPVLLQGCLP